MSAVKNHRYINKFYNKTAIISDCENFGKIIVQLESIDMHNFDLTLNSSLLNTWPNSTLMVAGYWTPALKNNPLHINNTQVAEAIDVSDTDMIRDFNKSEDSYNSSVSSSFIDPEFLHKLPAVILDEETRWNILMNQSSTYTTSTTVKDDHLSNVPKEDIYNKECIENKPIGPIMTDSKEDVSTLKIAKPNTNFTSVEEEEKPQSFHELLESYSPRDKNSFNRSEIDELYRQLVPKIILEEHLSDSNEARDDVSKMEIFLIIILGLHLSTLLFVLKIIINQCSFCIIIL